MAVRALCLFLLVTAGLRAVSIIHRPVLNAPKNSAIKIIFSLSSLKGISRATLYARQRGSGNYFSFPMVGSGRRYATQIPAYLVQNQGVEYYLEAVTNDGQQISFRSAQNPVQVRVSALGSEPAFRLLNPAENGISTDERPIISLVLTEHRSPLITSSVKVNLDGSNISESVIIRGNYVQYQPPINLRPGKHTIEISAQTIGGQPVKQRSYVFYVGSKESGETLKKKTSGRPQETLVVPTSFHGSTHKALNRRYQTQMVMPRQI